MGLPAAAANSAAPAAARSIAPAAAAVKPAAAQTKPAGAAGNEVWFDLSKKAVSATATKILIVGDKMYRDKLVELLKKIAGTTVGAALLDEINDKAVTGKLEIRQPAVDVSKPNANMCAADTKAADAEAAWAKGAVIHDHAGIKVVGKGTGSNVTVEFNPWNFDGNTCLGKLAGNIADEVLLHELVHCNRNMRGLVEKTTDKMGGYVNAEEGIAIIIANMYLSENGKSKLRGAYQTTHTITDDPVAFISSATNQTLVMKIYFQHPQLTRRLTFFTKTLKFNVLKAYRDCCLS